MLAVCIPVYNQNVEALISEIFVQSSALNDEVSIVIIDDHSDDSFQSQYNKFADKVKVVRLQENIGRSKIRNTFLLHTDAPYLLFLDCDSQLISNDFLSDYISEIKEYAPSVMFGASTYQKECPERLFRLRWRYGSRKESRSYVDRLNSPELSFKTNNFLIQRDVFAKYPFDENVLGYGHEDTLFGFKLEKNKIEIRHIDNPVLNAHLDSNIIFLNKTDEALRNLFRIWELSGFDQMLLQKLKVLRFQQKLQNLSVLRFVLIVLKKPVRFLLRSGVSNLYLFDLYKLCYLMSVKKGLR